MSIFYVFFTIHIYYARSCIYKKTEIIKGEIYVIGLYSMNITENQPDLMKSDAFAKHVQLTYLSSTLSEYSQRFGYIAYEICDDKSIMEKVIVSLILDKEFNLAVNSTGGVRSRIVSVFSHVSARLTKLLVIYLSFENIPIVSQLADDEIFRNQNHLIPNYFPTKKDISASYIINILKVNSSNEVIVVCLSNQDYLHVCKEVKTLISNEVNSCFSVLELYSKNYIEEAVLAIAPTDKSKTTIVIIANNKDHETFFNKMHEYKLYDRSIVSYGITRNIVEPLFSNENTSRVITDFKAVPLKLEIKLRPGKTTNFINAVMKILDIKKISDKKLLDLQLIAADEEYFMFIDFKECLDSRCNDINGLLDFAEEMAIPMRKRMRAQITNFGIFRYMVIHVTDSIAYNYVNSTSMKLYKTYYEIDKLPSLSCRKKICNASHESLFVQKPYGIWNYTKKWICQQCKDNFIQPNYFTNESCSACPFLYSPNDEHTECVDPYTEIYLSLDNHNIYIPISIIIISIIMVLSTVFVFTKYSKSKEIKASNKPMAIAETTLFLVFFISFPVLMIGRPSSMKCYVRPMIFGYTFSVVSAILLVKSNRLLKIFNASVRFTKSEIRISRFTDAMVIIFFIILETLLNFISVNTIQPKIVYKYVTESKEKLLFCSNNHHFVIHIIVTFIIFFMSIVQCFRIRKLPSVFNEANEILYATLMADFIFALTLILYYSRSREYDREYVILLMLSLMAASFYVLLFYKKMRMLLKRKSIKSNGVRLKMQMGPMDLKV